jgi:hypothetical protein
MGPVQKILFLTGHYLNSLAPMAQQAGQAAVLGRLSLNVCLWLSHIQRYMHSFPKNLHALHLHQLIHTQNLR